MTIATKATRGAVGTNNWTNPANCLTDDGVLIVEHHSEISKIKARMRLSNNDAALRVMEAEITGIEKHLAKIKREAEDVLLLTILM